MKKLIALLMVCGFAFAFVACGGGAKKDEGTDTAAPTADTVMAEPSDSITNDSIQ